MPKSKDPCCRMWANAHEPGTDNEGYGRLLHTDEAGSTTIGCGNLDDVVFCPWCGASKDKVEPKLMPDALDLSQEDKWARENRATYEECINRHFAKWEKAKFAQLIADAEWE